ncbi:MAG: hypothetical protein JWO03_676 [Bacteroidetes bacterium]|nr:hypothetical protein [Bacteroidota bacterium]
MTKYLSPLAILLIVLLSGCIKSADNCGAQQVISIVTYSSDYFTHPSDIYWGVTGTTRSYTYNWTFGDMCTKKNPKVDFIAEVSSDNSALPNPFSFAPATGTCFGVQAQSAAMLPSGGHDIYQSNESEIGMNQCFGGQAVGHVYPYIIVSFTTLGSSASDSAYLVDHLTFVKATVVYNDPK